MDQILWALHLSLYLEILIQVVQVYFNPSSSLQKNVDPYQRNSSVLTFVPFVAHLSFQHLSLWTVLLLTYFLVFRPLACFFINQCFTYFKDYVDPGIEITYCWEHWCSLMHPLDASYSTNSSLRSPECSRLLYFELTDCLQT